MNTSKYFPLRRVAGDRIPIKSIRVISSSAKFRPYEPDVKIVRKNNISDTVADPRYQHFFPDIIIDNNPVVPADGALDLPLPPPFSLPFRNESLYSISALTDIVYDTHPDAARKLSLSLEITLDFSMYTLKHVETPVVGGICYGGYPYLPYCINESFENTANHGLPRDFSLIAGSKQAGFIDSEYTYTKQEIISHSAFHYLCIDPVKTETLILNLSDFPHILKKAKLETISNTNNYKVLSLHEVYGFIIPYFYVFEYKEHTRYSPVVPTGVLASVEDPRPAMFQYPGSRTELRSYFDSEFMIQPLNNANGVATYAFFTASLLDGTERTYLFGGSNTVFNVPTGSKTTILQECYISNVLAPGDKVTIFFEQGEEFERCTAGIKALFPFIPEHISLTDLKQLQELFPGINLSMLLSLPTSVLEAIWIKDFKLPPNIIFCQSFLLRIYEIDPIEGVSPVSIPFDGTSKYATLLAEEKIDELSEELLAFYLEGIKFVRPSNSRYFAVELINTDNKDGQFVIRLLDFIQSAHVSVSTRAAKTQQVTTMNYRIIGEDLLEDYSRFSKEGFTLSVERWVAGSKKNVLFSAKTLLDLLQTGTAHVYMNQRRRAVEDEKSEVIGGDDLNYEKRRTHLKGWRSSETGEGVTWGEQHGIPDADSLGFVNMSNSQNKVITEYLYPDTITDNPDWTGASVFLDALTLIFEGGKDFGSLLQLALQNGDTSGLASLLVPIAQLNKLVSTNPIFDEWKGIDTTDKLVIHGLNNVAQSPYGPVAIGSDFVNDIIAAFNDLLQIVTDVSSGKFGFGDVIDFASRLGDFGSLIATVAGTGGPATLLALPTISGLSLSGNAQPVGLGLSFNGTPLLPSIMMNTTFGNQGSISRQSSTTGYAFSQFLNKSYDHGKTIIEEGEMNRRISRKIDAEFPTERIKGAEVMWQGKIVDIVTGSIPLNYTLPASASKIYHTTDDSLRVKFGSGVDNSISVDIWFDIIEEFIKDDY